MNKPTESAASSLAGKIINNKWTVLKRIEQAESATGGFFSVSYIVTDGKKEAFLKAINFQAFFQLFQGRSIIEILKEQTNAFSFEKELLTRCRNKNLSKVVTLLDEGEEHIDGYTIPNVPYLIFEVAEGDIRSKIKFNNNLEVAWKLRSLHNVAIGIKQLHYIEISHQDLKPSNVLLYDDGVVSKIGDLGRSLCNDLEAPHENGNNFTGDFNYAPPEFLYRYVEAEWSKRVKATDMYLFGSLIVFYFTGTNMTALIGKNIDRQFLWNTWKGTFSEVKDYIIDAFYSSIDDFKSSIPNEKLAIKLAELIEICCFPDPEKRGHPKSISQIGNQYDFQRIISKLDILASTSEYFK